jgi:hypothetical protein
MILTTLCSLVLVLRPIWLSFPLRLDQFFYRCLMASSFSFIRSIARPTSVCVIRMLMRQGKPKRRILSKDLRMPKTNTSRSIQRSRKRFAFRRRPRCRSVNSSKEEQSPELFDRPYFGAPKDEVRTKALSIIAPPSRRQTPWASARSLLADVNTSWRSHMLILILWPGRRWGRCQR